MHEFERQYGMPWPQVPPTYEYLVTMGCLKEL